MKISYIITAHNRIGTVLIHIMSVLLDNKDRDIEIIIADDGSTDDTEKQIRKLISLEKYNIKYANTESYDKATPSKARNMGINLATGKFLIFADEDCIPHKNLVNHYIELLKRGYVGVGYKRSERMILKLNSDNKEEIINSLAGMSHTLYFERYLKGHFGSGHFTSGSFALWREDLGEVRFDEDFVGYGIEDKHFGYLLGQSGLKFDYIIQAMSYHCQDNYNRPREQKTEETIKNRKLYNEKIK